MTALDELLIKARVMAVHPVTATNNSMFAFIIAAHGSAGVSIDPDYEEAMYRVSATPADQVSSPTHRYLNMFRTFYGRGLPKESVILSIIHADYTSAEVFGAGKQSQVQDALDYFHGAEKTCLEDVITSAARLYLELMMIEPWGVHDELTCRLALVMALNHGGILFPPVVDYDPAAIDRARALRDALSFEATLEHLCGSVRGGIDRLYSSFIPERVVDGY